VISEELFMRRSIWNAIERKLDDYSLRKKFYIFYVLCVMLPLIVTDAVVLSIVNNAEKESSRHEMSSIASAVGYNLSSMVNNAGEAAKSIYTSKRIDDFISKEYTSSAEYVSEYQSFFQDTLFENTLGMSNIVFFLYADNPTIVNGGKVNDMSAVRNTDSYRLLEQKGSGGLFFAYEKGGAGLSDERRMIYMQKLDFYSSDIEKVLKVNF
jgi:two-component system sensor histidine kinase YesM